MDLFNFSSFGFLTGFQFAVASARKYPRRPFIPRPVAFKARSGRNGAIDARIYRHKNSPQEGDPLPRDHAQQPFDAVSCGTQKRMQPFIHFPLYAAAHHPMVGHQVPNNRLNRLTPLELVALEILSRATLYDRRPNPGDGLVGVNYFERRASIILSGAVR